MAKMVFKVNGGGDRSVGILETEATITVEDNFTEIDKTQVEIFREFLREFYDIPKHMGAVLTLEEYEIEQKAEQQFYDEMRKDYEKERVEEDTRGDFGLITDMTYPEEE
jgi:hypothetical protein